MLPNHRSRNFSLKEVIHRHETFPEELLPIAYIALGTLQTLRDIVDAPLIIESGYRDKWYNSTLSNSSPNSYHMWRWDGDRPVFALDIKCPTVSSKDLAAIVAKYIYGEVYEHTSMKFVHLAPRWDKDETFAI